MFENMKEQTFTAQHTVHDHIQSIGVFGLVVVSRELLAAIAEKQCYFAYCEEQKKEQLTANISKK